MDQTIDDMNWTRSDMMQEQIRYNNAQFPIKFLQFVLFRN